MPGNTVTVTANYKPIEHRLTVKGGSGSGAFPAGTKVSIAADSPPQDRIFVNWTTQNGGTFLGEASMRTTFVMPRNAATVMAIYKPIDSYYSGQHLSAGGKTKYEIDSVKRRFSFYTLLGGRFLLQTEISPYEVRRANASEQATVPAIEISGTDNRAGGGPSASLRLTKISESEFKLERIKPVGGDLGLFHKQP